MNMNNVFMRGCLLAATLIGIAAPASAQAIINNGTVQLGVNQDASLNVGGGPRSSGGTFGGTTTVGLRYIPTNAEATAPGCTCEGWGLGDDISRIWGGANTAVGGRTNIVVELFSADASTAQSVVRVGGIFRITHVYRPSPSPNLYQVDISIENISTSNRQPVYRRAMDWDIEPTPFNEYTTIITRGPGAAVPTSLRFASNNGFANSNVFSNPA